MDDMTAFERQVAGETVRAMGPTRAVDDLAIFAAASTQSPQRRSQSMFSATKFVVAGVIVALFGSFLVAGVLTQQSVEIVPAVAVSPSPTASYVVTDISGAMTDLRDPRWFTHVATDDALWFSDAWSVYRMDAATGEVTEIPLEGEARWLIPSDDAIWAVSAFGVQRIDRADLSVLDKMVGRSRGQPLMWESQGGEPIIAGDSLWIMAPGDDPPVLIEVDLETVSVAGEYVAEDWSSAADGKVSQPWMAAFGGDIWIYSDGRLTQFDRRAREFSGVRVNIPDVETSACCIASEGAIWLPQGSGSLWRFDVGTLDVTDALDFGPGLGAGVAAAGSIWVPVYAFGDDENGIYRIDAETRQVTDVVAVDSRKAPAFLHGAVWVEGQDTLSRIDVETRQVTDVITLSTEKVLEPLASDGVIWAFTEYGGSYRIEGGPAIE